jgi:transposase-like protein
MNVAYRCADCDYKFMITVTEEEWASGLRYEGVDACPQCGVAVGRGSVSCRSCGRRFPVDLPHWHVACNVASGKCPSCGSEYVSGCIC